MQLESILAELPLSAPDRAALAALANTIPREHSVRAVWLRPLEDALRDEAPHAVPTYERFVELVGRARAFAWLPLTHALLSVVRLATLAPLSAVAAGAPLETRTNAYLEHCMGRMFRHTMLRALHQACGGDLMTFLEMSAQSHDLFYDHGSAWPERLAPERLCMHFEQHHADAERYLLLGYWRGVARQFGVRGEVRFETLAPTAFDLVIELNAAA